MKRHGESWLGLWLGLLVLLCPVEGFSQPTGYTGREQEAELRPDAHIYAVAIALSESLGKSGIVVNCMLNSTMEGTFEGETGATVYRTNRGSFEVLFLARGESFDRLSIFELHKGDRYSYRFKGPPQPWPANLIDSFYRIYFIKKRNILFVVERDAELAAVLQKFAHPQP